MGCGVSGLRPVRVGEVRFVGEGVIREDRGVGGGGG